MDMNGFERSGRWLAVLGMIAICTAACSSGDDTSAAGPIDGVGPTTEGPTFPDDLDCGIHPDVDSACIVTVDSPVAVGEGALPVLASPSQDGTVFLTVSQADDDSSLKVELLEPVEHAGVLCERVVTPGVTKYSCPATAYHPDEHRLRVTVSSPARVHTLIWPFKGNSAPTPGAITFSVEAPTAEDTVCYTMADPSDDVTPTDDLSVSCTLKHNGATKPVTCIAPAQLSPGDTIGVECSVTDAHGATATVSKSVTVAMTECSCDLAVIQPGTPTGSEKVTVQCQVWSNTVADAGCTILVTGEDGVTLAETPRLPMAQCSATIPAEKLAKGDAIDASITCWDGDVKGLTVSAFQGEVGNSPPSCEVTIQTPGIPEPPPTADTTINGMYECTDPDGDELQTVAVRWYVNGEEVVGAFGQLDFNAYGYGWNGDILVKACVTATDVDGAKDTFCSDGIQLKLAVPLALVTIGTDPLGAPLTRLSDYCCGYLPPEGDDAGVPFFEYVVNDDPAAVPQPDQGDCLDGKLLQVGDQVSCQAHFYKNGVYVGTEVSKGKLTIVPADLQASPTWSSPDCDMGAIYEGCTVAIDPACWDPNIDNQCASTCVIWNLSSATGELKGQLPIAAATLEMVPAAYGVGAAQYLAVRVCECPAAPGTPVDESTCVATSAPLGVQLPAPGPPTDVTISNLPGLLVCEADGAIAPVDGVITYTYQWTDQAGAPLADGPTLSKTLTTGCEKVTCAATPHLEGGGSGSPGTQVAEAGGETVLSMSKPDAWMTLSVVPKACWTLSMELRPDALADAAVLTSADAMPNPLRPVIAVRKSKKEPGMLSLWVSTTGSGLVEVEGAPLLEGEWRSLAIQSCDQSLLLFLDGAVVYSKPLNLPLTAPDPIRIGGGALPFVSPGPLGDVDRIVFYGGKFSDMPTLTGSVNADALKPFDAYLPIMFGTGAKAYDLVDAPATLSPAVEWTTDYDLVVDIPDCSFVPPPTRPSGCSLQVEGDGPVKTVTITDCDEPSVVINGGTPNLHLALIVNGAQYYPLETSIVTGDSITFDLATLGLVPCATPELRFYGSVLHQGELKKGLPWSLSGLMLSHDGPTTCVGASCFWCDDDNVCTADSCTLDAGGCFNKPTDAGCDDGEPCTSDDQCDPATGVCEPGKALECDDDNPCTNDGCSGGTCFFDTGSEGAACSDGDACTVKDHCTGGECESGGPMACDDGNPCTKDSCHQAAGCIKTKLADGTACSDGDPLTEGDQCFQAACAAGPTFHGWPDALDAACGDALVFDTAAPLSLSVDDVFGKCDFDVSGPTTRVGLPSGAAGVFLDCGGACVGHLVVADATGTFHVGGCVSASPDGRYIPIPKDGKLYSLVVEGTGAPGVLATVVPVCAGPECGLADPVCGSSYTCAGVPLDPPASFYGPACSQLEHAGVESAFYVSPEMIAAGAVVYVDTDSTLGHAFLVADQDGTLDLETCLSSVALDPVQLTKVVIPPQESGAGVWLIIDGVALGEVVANLSFVCSSD